MGWDLIGHGWAVRFLEEHLEAGALHHAYLITGPDAVGKRTLALRLAQALTCQQGGVAPCLQCRACQRLENGQHPDLHLVEAESVGGTLKVDQIRQLQRQISLAPYEGGRRVVILLRLQEMSQQAGNALLKTVEEPPPQVVMVMTARSPEAVLPTLVSRCELLPLRPVPQEELVAGLKLRVEPERAELLGALAAGRPGVALAMLDDEGALEARNLEIEQMYRLLAAPRADRFVYANKMNPGRDLSRERREALAALEVWLSLWRDVFLLGCGAEVPFANPDQAERVQDLALATGGREAAEVARAIRETKGAIDRNANLQLALESLLLKMPRVEEV